VLLRSDRGGRRGASAPGRRGVGPPPRREAAAHQEAAAEGGRGASRWGAAEFRCFSIFVVGMLEYWI